MPKFCDPKGAVLRDDFGDAKRVRLSPTSDKEPKAALKPPFWAGSKPNALAIQN